MSSNPIIEKLVWHVKFRIEEPLCVSGGTDAATDMDVIKDFDGHPFVPGSSAAGAFKHYLEECGENTSLLGGGSGDDSRMSPLLISDLRFEADGDMIDERDGVKLENKRAVDGSKFDMEIVKIGTTGTLELELNIREKDKDSREIEWKDQVLRILGAVNAGDIRLGARKTRGFGRLSVTEVWKKAFSKDNVESWLEYMPGNTDGFTSVIVDKEENQALFASIVFPLRLSGGISIRRYSARPGAADYETLTVNGPDRNVSAVVPGSSWNGAIRSRAGEILSDFGVGNVTNILREWFGYVDEKERTAKQSQVYIRESLIRGGTELEMVRNKIDRFSGGMAEGSLYRERSYFEGDLELELRVKKTCPDWKALCGLLLLIAKDIEKGYLPVGGQTAVGRGIFESGGEEKNVSRTEEQEYMHALAEFIIERRLG